MTTKRLTTISKFLSKYLRHQPEELGLTLEPGGWVHIEALLAASAAHGFAFTRDELEQVVATNDKQRFALDRDSDRIRANQGHSAQVDLMLEPVEPPAVLYHGTTQHSLDSILASGLQKRSRHHVHLSGDVATARQVGSRHGPPVVLRVDAAGMRQAGYQFYRSANGVWLTDHVPPGFLSEE